jgi:hypothetical protein
MSNVRAGILGTGHAYPEGILTNADLEQIVDTTDEWITTRTGIKQRRKAAPDEYTSSKLPAKPCNAPESERKNWICSFAARLRQTRFCLQPAA